MILGYGAPTACQKHLAVDAWGQQVWANEQHTRYARSPESVDSSNQ